jgi:gamma-glutamyltranspeptidase/glutathione hydrolase
MSPTLVLDDDGKVVLAVGASGGSTIISSVLQTILNVIEFDMDPQAAVAAPRIHHQWQPDILRLEPEIPHDVRVGLKARKHLLQVGRAFSSTQAVTDGEDGTVGGSDPRKGGRPAGVPPEE